MGCGYNVGVSVGDKYVQVSVVTVDKVAQCMCTSDPICSILNI